MWPKRHLLIAAAAWAGWPADQRKGEATGEEERPVPAAGEEPAAAGPSSEAVPEPEIARKPVRAGKPTSCAQPLSLRRKKMLGCGAGTCTPCILPCIFVRIFLGGDV